MCSYTMTCGVEIGSGKKFRSTFLWITNLIELLVSTLNRLSLEVFNGFPSINKTDIQLSKTGKHATNQICVKFIFS